MKSNALRVGLAQISPVWLDKQKTLEKVVDYILKASKEGCDMVCFGEALVPGYPFWLEFTEGARFNDAKQKEIFALYHANALDIDADLLDIKRVAKENKIAVYLGSIERGKNRGGSSLYCSLLYINQEGELVSCHRKLVPTYEERLVWSPGDGNGLQVHEIGDFVLGGLNCWENWMPLSRVALRAQGENVHIAVWPGSIRNTENITPFIAFESRSYVISVSSLMRKSDIPSHFDFSEEMIAKAPEVLADGGSCIASPDGKWLVEPVVGEEILITADLDYTMINRERQMLDITGHYSRPDVTKLIVNRERQGLVNFK